MRMGREGPTPYPFSDLGGDDDSRTADNRLPVTSILEKQKTGPAWRGEMAGPVNCNALSIGSGQTASIPQMSDLCLSSLAFRERSFAEACEVRKTKGPEH
jgi:hypothetical protein